MKRQGEDIFDTGEDTMAELTRFAQEQNLKRVHDPKSGLADSHRRLSSFAPKAGAAAHFPRA
jgi:hypothetical protein